MRSPVLAVVCVVLTSQVQASNVRDLLGAMETAGRHIDFDAQMVFSASGAVETVKLQHRSENGVLHERMVSASGVEREVLRDNDSVRCVERKSTGAPMVSVLVDRNTSPQIYPPAPAFLNGYQYRATGSDVVAGQLCEQVAILPPDDLRYGYELCIDPSSGLLLRQKTVTEGGRVVEQMIVTALDLAPPEEMDGAFLSRGDLLKPLPEALQEAAERDLVKFPPGVAWSSVILPHGFRLVHQDVRERSDLGESVAHLVLDDGMATISVFIDSIVPGPSKAKSTRSGALSSLLTSYGRQQMILLGEVPLHTLEQVAAAFKAGEGE